MPRKPAYMNKLDEWVLYLEEKKYSPGTYKKSYPSYARRAYATLKAAGMTTDPRKIGPKEALYVVNNTFRNQARCIAGWNNFLKFCKNPVLEVTDYATVQTPVTRADWLNLDRCEDILVWRSCTKPLEIILIHLELHLCMRNIEVQRQLLSWFGKDDILVHGKGRKGGKFRTIAYHPYTPDVLNMARKWRAQSEELAGEPMPDNITAYYEPHRKKIIVPGETTLRNVLIGMKEKSGLHFAHHTLRRTGARRYWKAGAPVEKIAKHLGHVSTEMTIRYLGINIEDQKEMMELGAVYDNRREVQQQEEYLSVARWG